MKIGKRTRRTLTTVLAATMAVCFTLQIAACGTKKEEETVRNLVGLELNTASVETEFFVDEEFSSDGLVVTAKYDAAPYSEAVTDYEVSSPDMTTTGTKSVTVSYKSVSDRYDISIVNGITMTNQTGEDGAMLGKSVVSYIYDTQAVALKGASELNGKSLKFTAQVASGYKITKVTATVGGETVYSADASANNSYTVPASVLTDNAVVTVSTQSEDTTGTPVSYYYNETSEEPYLTKYYSADVLDSMKTGETPAEMTFLAFDGWTEVALDDGGIAMYADWSLSDYTLENIKNSMSVTFNKTEEESTGDYTNATKATIHLDGEIEKGSTKSDWKTLVTDLNTAGYKITALGLVLANKANVTFDIAGKLPEDYKTMKAPWDVNGESVKWENVRFGPIANADSPTAYLYGYGWSNRYGTMAKWFNIATSSLHKRYFSPWIMIEDADGTQFPVQSGDFRAVENANESLIPDFDRAGYSSLPTWTTVLSVGQKATVTGNMTLSAESPLGHEGILPYLGEMQDGGKYNYLVFRYDYCANITLNDKYSDFINNTYGNTGWRQITITSMSATVNSTDIATMLKQITKTPIDITLVYDYMVANKVTITISFNGGTYGSFKMEYVIASSNLSETLPNPFIIGLGGENASLKNGKCVFEGEGVAHDHFYVNGVCTVCGEVCTHEKMDGTTCKDCGGVITNSTAPLPAWSDARNATFFTLYNGGSITVSGVYNGKGTNVWDGICANILAHGSDTKSLYFIRCDAAYMYDNIVTGSWTTPHADVAVSGEGASVDQMENAKTSMRVALSDNVMTITLIVYGSSDTAISTVTYTIQNMNAVSYKVGFALDKRVFTTDADVEQAQWELPTFEHNYRDGICEDCGTVQNPYQIPGATTVENATFNHTEFLTGKWSPDVSLKKGGKIVVYGTQTGGLSANWNTLNFRVNTGNNATSVTLRTDNYGWFFDETKDFEHRVEEANKQQILKDESGVDKKSEFNYDTNYKEIMKACDWRVEFNWGSNGITVTFTATATAGGYKGWTYTQTYTIAVSETSATVDFGGEACTYTIACYTTEGLN